MVALFHATGGTSWKRNDNWDTDADLSKWYGVKVNDQGRVVKLDLNRNNLQGMYVCMYVRNVCMIRSFSLSEACSYGHSFDVCLAGSLDL